MVGWWHFEINWPDGSLRLKIHTKTCALKVFHTGYLKLFNYGYFLNHRSYVRHASLRSLPVQMLQKFTWSTVRCWIWSSYHSEWLLKWPVTRTSHESCRTSCLRRTRHTAIQRFWLTIHTNIERCGRRVDHSTYDGISARWNNWECQCERKPPWCCRTLTDLQHTLW